MRRTLNVRRAAASFLAVPLALGALVACGSDDGEDKETSAGAGPSASASPEAGETDSGDPEADPTASATESGEQGGDGDPETEPGGEEQQPGTKISTEDFMALLQGSLTGTAHVTMRNEGGLVQSTSEGDMDFSSDPPSMDLTMNAPDMGGDMHMVLLDDVIYMRMGDLSKGKYLKLDLNDPENMMGEEMTAQLDPRTSLNMMKDAVTEVSYLGRTSLDGDQVDQYRAVIDPGRMFKDEEIPADSIPKRMTYEVWVDDDNRIRQVVTKAGKQLGSSIITYSDWGKKVTVKAPPASQVEEMPKR